MKKGFCLLLAFALALGAAGCSPEAPEVMAGAPSGPASRTFEGDGWSLVYDPELFAASGEGRLTYTGEDSPLPVYLTAQNCPDYTAAEAAGAVAANSGTDGTRVEDAAIGRDGIPAKYVYTEQLVGEISETVQYRYYYAVELETGCVLLEIGSYDGAPAAAGEALEAMLGSLTLQ